MQVKISVLGYSHVDDFLMVTFLYCWERTHYVGDLFRHVSYFFNITNRSPRFQSCHQHKPSPKSVTNIAIALKFTCQVSYLVQPRPSAVLYHGPTWTKQHALMWNPLYFHIFVLPEEFLFLCFFSLGKSLKLCVIFSF